MVDQIKVNSGTVARGQTSKQRMGPAPDTDVEEEETENKMEEGGEVVDNLQIIYVLQVMDLDTLQVMDIDDGIENLLLETSMTQSDYGESQDLDSILKPLTDSQRAKEEELDR